MKKTEPVRRFNRWYAEVLGVFDNHAFGTEYSLTQGRILEEISLAPSCTANEISALLHIDRGYLSRLLTDLEKRGLLQRIASSDDRRRKELVLTEQGKRAWQMLDRKSDAFVKQTTAGLSDEDFHRLTDAMKEIMDLLGRDAG